MPDNALVIRATSREMLRYLAACAKAWERELAEVQGPVNCEFRIQVQGRQITRRRVHYDGTDTAPPDDRPPSG